MKSPGKMKIMELLKEFPDHSLDYKTVKNKIDGLIRTFRRQNTPKPTKAEKRKSSSNEPKAKKRKM